MEILIGTNIATFILAWIVSRLVAKGQFIKEETERRREIEKTKVWIDYLNNLKGGQNG